MLDNRLQLKFLPPEALDQIEQTAFRLLDEVGISLQHAAAQEMLHGAGCRIEEERAHIPRRVVQWALDNLTPHRDLHTGPGETMRRRRTTGQGQ